MIRRLQLDPLEKRSDGIIEEIEKIFEFFKDQGQYYYEAVSSVMLAEALDAAGRSREAVEPVKRTSICRQDTTTTIGCEARYGEIRTFSVSKRSLKGCRPTSDKSWRGAVP